MRTKEVYQADVDATVNMIYGYIAQIVNTYEGRLVSRFPEKTATALNVKRYEMETQVRYYRDLASRLERGVIPLESVENDQ